MLNALNEAMVDYGGDWTVTECREDFIELQQGERSISFERDCTTNDVSQNNCSDTEIRNYLAECVWVILAPNDTTVTGLAIDFSNQSIHVSNAEGTIVEEGNWDLTDGVIMLNALNEAMTDYGGDWTVTECREDFIELQQEERNISFERDCTP